MSTGKYLADLCEGCGEIRVVNMATHHVYRAYSSSPYSLYAMCSGPGEGSLLVCNTYGSGAVIQLQWDEATKKLDEVRRVQVPGDIVYCMCYIPQADLLIVIRRRIDFISIMMMGRRTSDTVEAVKLQGGDYQNPVWHLHGEVLGKKINPLGVSSDSDGWVYVADGRNSRVLVVNCYTGEVIQQLLQDADLGRVHKICCPSNPHQLFVGHSPDCYPNLNDLPDTLSLYNITSL